jgi:hypothetical protein
MRRHDDLPHQVALELLGPTAALLAPLWAPSKYGSTARRLVLLAIFGLHVGIAFTMRNTFLLSSAAITAWLPFLDCSCCGSGAKGGRGAEGDGVCEGVCEGRGAEGDQPPSHTPDAPSHTPDAPRTTPDTPRMTSDAPRTPPDASRCWGRQLGLLAWVLDSLIATD